MFNSDKNIDAFVVERRKYVWETMKLNTEQLN